MMIEALPSNTKRSILCVDDEPEVLDGLRRNLGLEFDVHVARGGAEGLTTLASGVPFCAVVSDMRMPEMTGSEFLKRARELVPDVSRILLTGQADISSAIAAVNDGQIFRFLTKPCPRDDLVKALRDGIRQYELLCSERILLEQTLRGVVGVMVEAVGLVVPTEAQPMLKVRRLAMELCRRLEIDRVWDVEVAITFAHVGTLTLPPEALRNLRLRTHHGVDLLAMVSRSNVVAQRLAARIPRFEPVRDLLREAGRLAREPDAASSPPAWVVRACTEFGRLLAAGVAFHAAMLRVREAIAGCSASFLQHFDDIAHQAGTQLERSITFEQLIPGMTLLEPLRMLGDVVLTPADTEVTTALIEQLRNFAEFQRLIEPFLIREPYHV